MVGLLLAGMMLLTTACTSAKETGKEKMQNPSETETETEEQGVQMAEDTRYTVDTKLEDGGLGWKIRDGGIRRKRPPEACGGHHAVYRTERLQ